MKMCQPHWDALKAKLAERDLMKFASQDGEHARARLDDQALQTLVTRENWDPLLAAMFAIFSNAMQTLERAGYNPLYLLSDGAQAPEGRSTCPVCELNYLHRTSCTDPACGLDRERGYDWMLDAAVKEQDDEGIRLGLVARPS